MIKLISASSGHPDYILLQGEMDRGYTVGEAIDEIVSSNPKNIVAFCVCGYVIRARGGTLVGEIPDYIKDFAVTEIKGTDSWGQLMLTMKVNVRGA